MDFVALQYLLGMAGTVAFAATGVAAVAPKRVDLFGAVVLGIITAIGGGTIRDLILDVPVFWAVDLNYLWVALGASMLAFLAHKSMTRGQIYRSMLYLDGFGAAMFAIQAARKVMDLDFGLPLAPILLGVTTAIGGGLIRDVLAGNTTLLMRRDIYAVPITLGCVVYAALMPLFPGNAGTVGVVSVALIFGIRSAAIRWDLKFPDWLATRPDNNGL
ncbi:trimeric intracellular cation channel family protein [Acuticoccus kandeliae]|uniref:trimeric intracellular cation channel family protein n=1 Tax=Acuticoccus kandeliae TaxID=2073160 RepID=UPI000D3ED697|nr:trimeric intracellular cation channel family protein [Acuticoccus kandeliae]